LTFCHITEKVIDGEFRPHLRIVLKSQFDREAGAIFGNNVSNANTYVAKNHSQSKRNAAWECTSNVVAGK